MTDREKVIEGFEMSYRYSNVDENNTLVPQQLVLDTIALLKAQEPMLVKHTTSTIRCPKCNKQITSRGAIHKEIKYCWKCGQAVKWDG